MAQSEKVAVIDVGSNSCRLVIYERQGSALLPYFNEKSMAGLGRNLSQSGVLYPNGKRKALETFRRFQAILEGLGISNVIAVATAAVREAEDGPAFKVEAEQALNTRLRILSGADEGRLSARGVIFGRGTFDGIAADLGGSSVEIESCSVGDDRQGETYLLGPLARIEDQHLSLEKRRKRIAKILDKSKLLATSPRQLVAVGGAWRNIAMVHMMLTDYPLRVVNQYPLSRKALATVLSAVTDAEKDEALRERLGKVAKKRYDTMVHAALVLEGLLLKAGLKQASIAAYGLREGVIADLLGDLERGDNLTDAIRLYLNLGDASMAFGSSLDDFVSGIFKRSHPDRRLIQATCQMADAGARMHPDHRPDLIYHQVVRAPLPWFDHRGRLIAAFAMASRYTFKFEAPSELQRLYDHSDVKLARTLGTAMRLGGAFSGRSSSILTTAKLEKTSSELILRVWKKNEDMVSGTVKRRLRQLAELIGREPAIEIVDRF